MKIRIKPLLLAILSTILSLFFALLFSIGQPYYDIENAIIICVILFNLPWFAEYGIKYHEKQDKAGFKQILIIYLLVISIPLLFKFYNRPFDSVKWKTELIDRTIVGNIPLHKNGNMLPVLIRSKLLIGKPIETVKGILGKHYYLPGDHPSEGKDFTMIYWYIGTHDNCNGFFVEIKDSICIKVDIIDCD